MAETLNLPTTDIEDTEDLLADLRNGEWLDAQVFPEITWAVPGIIPEGLTMLVGGPKIGKSWMALNFALAAAAGGVALGRLHVGPARPVLYLALEDGDRRMQERCRKLLAGASIPYEFQYKTRVKPRKIIATIRAWLDSLPGTGYAPPLAILDTLGKAMPPALPGESAYSRDYRIASDLKDITDEFTGMSLLVLHHDRKMITDDFVDAVSGTNGIAGAVDTVLVLARKRTEATGLIKVTGRDVDENQYAVRTAAGVWSIVGDDLAAAAAAATEIEATVNLGDQASEVVRFVTKQAGVVSPKMVGEALDMSNHDASNYLARLAESGRIRKVKRGLYTALTVLQARESVESVESDNPNSTHSTVSRPIRVVADDDEDDPA